MKADGISKLEHKLVPKRMTELNTGKLAMILNICRCYIGYSLFAIIIPGTKYIATVL